MAGDRVDVFGSTLRSFLSLRPDNLLTETGIKAELTHHGVRSRLGQNRTDLKHQWLDPLVVLAPWGVTAWAVARVVRRTRGRVTSR